MPDDNQPDVQPVPTDADKYGVTQEPAVEPAEDNSIEPDSTDGQTANGGGR